MFTSLEINARKNENLNTKNPNKQFVSFLFTDQEQVFILQLFLLFQMFTSLRIQCKKK